MAMQTPPPPAQGMKPYDYFNTLVSQGMRPFEAYQAVQANFGPAPSREQQAKDQAAAEQRAGIGQAAGSLAGILGMREALAGFPNVSGLFGTSAGVEMPTALGGTGILGGAGVTAGTAGAGTVATPTLVGANIVPGAGGVGAGTLGSIGSVALPVAIAAGAISNAWETGMKDILRGRGTREDWINQGVNVATSFLPNTALRLMGKRSIGKMMTTGKSDAQLLRDDFRGMLKQTGVADDKYNVTLADGSKFNIGLDGKTKYQNVGENIDGKTTRNAWDVDFSNPLAQYAVKQIDPMIRNIYQGADGKIKPEQYTGMLVNAATSNANNEADVLANINSMLAGRQLGEEIKPAARPINAAQATTPQVSVPEQAKKQSLRDFLNQRMSK